MTISETELDVRPLSPTIGAEIHGIDCAADLDVGTVAAIRRVWLERLVVFFPDQHLDDETQIAFAERFGELTESHPVEPQVLERKEVHSIESGKDRTDFWHTDITFMNRPAMASMLRSVLVPAAGGDTMWSDTRAAYDALAPSLQKLCDGLSAYHYEPYYAQAVAEGHGNVWEGKKLTRLLPATHPVVRVHPETGRKNLFVNPKFTVRVADMPEAQSDGLLKLLYDHMTRPEFIVRYHWSPGTLAVWDNRATMHFGIFDYEGDTRVMHRVTLRGDRPVGPTPG
ncbi:MAG TPA: TauD/TfdA family dioxygenase [Acidimicrobiales bacterium]|nr:TauD/TfdA family dioxygenase [Acidimicrobiales bacterium]